MKNTVEVIKETLLTMNDIKATLKSGKDLNRTQLLFLRKQGVI